MPKGSFYHYFPSKEAYGCALLEDFVTEYGTRLDGSLTHPAWDARARLLAYFADWQRKQVSPDPAERCLIVKLSAEIADLSPDMSRILRDGVESITGRLAATLREGLADGSIAAIDDPEATAEAIYHLWLGASLVASLAHDDAALAAAMRTTKRLVPPGPSA